jgi:hypothetical protein
MPTILIAKASFSANRCVTHYRNECKLPAVLPHDESEREAVRRLFNYLCIPTEADPVVAAGQVDVEGEEYWRRVCQCRLGRRIRRIMSICMDV